MPHVVPLVPVAILAVVSVVLVRFVLREPRTANVWMDPIAVGTLTRLERTGRSVGGVVVYRLHLDVQTLDGRHFRGVVRRAVPDVHLPRLQPDTLLTVVHDPTGPAALAFPAQARAVEMHRVLTQVRIRMGLTDPWAPRVSERGMRTQGVVMSRVATGQMRHGHTELDVSIGFTRHDRQMVQRRRKLWVSPADRGRFEPGARVTVEYLPDDDTQFNVHPAAAG